MRERELGRCAAGAAAGVLVVLSLAAGCGDEGGLASSATSAGSAGSTSQGGGESPGAGGAEVGSSGGGDGSGQGGDASAGTGGGAGGGDLPAFVPEPIPRLDDEPAGPCAQLDDQPYDLQFLHGVCEPKGVPTDLDRDRPCPILDTSPHVPLTGGGTAFYRTSDAPLAIDDVSLTGVVPDELDVTVIQIRRVDGRPHTRVLSNGSHFDAFQPWSSTKFLAAANAAARIRIASGFEVGLTARVDGRPLGDLVSSMHLYDWDPFSSNALGRYFHDVGGRQRANDMIHEAWLGRPGEETFGGNYGEASPGLSTTFEEEGGESVSIAPDATSGPANRLSTFTLAEALKRLVLHREEPTQRLDGIQWEDLRVLFRGAEGASAYGAFGGMSADRSVYMQAGHDLAYLERRSHGQWRIVSKLGNGSEGQLVNVAYGCFPVLDDAGAPVAGWGRELVVAAHLPAGSGPWAERDRILARAFRAIMIRVIDGRL